jgi:hypothetical protein
MILLSHLAWVYRHVYSDGSEITRAVTEFYCWLCVGPARCVDDNQCSVLIEYVKKETL